MPLSERFKQIRLIISCNLAASFKLFDSELILTVIKTFSDAYVKGILGNILSELQDSPDQAA